MSDKKLKRRLNAFFRLLIILSICVITVYLFPKVGSFQYEYQKGMPWRYETLTAPFDFPIHKTEDELQEEREKLVQEQSPIFILNTNTADLQTGKFRTALHAFRNETTSGSLNKLTDRLKDIYTAGILQLPEELDARKVKTIKIVENNIGHTVEFDQVYLEKGLFGFKPGNRPTPFSEIGTGKYSKPEPEQLFAAKPGIRRLENNDRTPEPPEKYQSHRRHGATRRYYHHQA